MKPRLILIMQTGDFPRLEPAIAVSTPDTNGMVMLYEPFEWKVGDEPVIAVPVQYCFAFDPDLMRDANGLCESARDALGAVAKMIVARVKPPFGPEEMGDWIVDPPIRTIMH